MLGSRAIPRHFVLSKTLVISTHLPSLRRHEMVFASASLENFAGRLA
ncbi:hypothetical protein R2F25_38230 [Streptomyces sp. UP1A-1]|nr:hypothetical protein [Streptomyces sp. UP1A-1]